MNHIYNQEDDNVHQLIVKVRKLMLTSQLVRGLLIWLVVTLGMWLVLFTLDNFLHFPEGLRLALVLGGFGLMAFEFWQLLLLPVIRRQRLESVTLFLESRFAIPENMLINALCFESAWLSPKEEPFAQETIRTGSEMMSEANINELWQHKKLVRWLVALIILILLWFIYGISQGHQVANALLRYIRPLSDVPPASSLILEVTPSDDIFMAEGDDLEIRVEVKGLDGDKSLPRYPEVVWGRRTDYISNERGKNKGTSMQLSGESRNNYGYTFKSVDESFAFRVFAADTYTHSVKVTVNRLPRIKESQFHILAPSYTGGGRMSMLGPPEALAGPAGSEVIVDVKLDKSAEELWYKGAGDWVPFKNKDGLWTAKTQLQPAESYKIEVKANEFEQRIKIAEGPILAQQDRRPEVEFVTSELNRRVNLGERLRLDIQAYDDFGAKKIYVKHKSVRTGSSETTVGNWDYEGPPGKTESLETLLLSVDASLFKPGGSYILEAFCEDFSPAGNVGRSKPLMLQVKSLDEMTIAEDDPNSDAFAELDNAIKAQQTALGVNVNLMANLDEVIDANNSEAQNRDSVKGHLSQMGQKQEKVGSHITKAWEVSIEPKPEFVTRLIELRDNEHTRILKKIVEAAAAERVDNSSVSRGLKSIEKQQVYLLDELIALKGIVAKKSEAEAQKAVAELLGEKEESLSPTPEETLENTVKELDEFIKKQKDITQKRQMVLDKPPEDFSEEEEELLEDLAMDQSKLAEIMAEVVDDLSNMNLLDFGDNQMVDEMTSINEAAEELADKAAEAAEMQQARQDAYRLETEAVEMAEELMINCEATLGASDSIQFVVEIPEDEQLAAPLAELPSELEDLVGDMITSEEEMRPEVEDIGSYLNSLDHTAGPVADGTISSTSAKGKTGDQRPEDNVLEGRSGAGRTGMSDGQLVESVAKDLDQNEYGLRERVSNTPLEDGQVEDQDVGAATGGTGLGKTTDSTTQFGVGGKLPPKVLEMMQATLETQQNIRQASQDLVLKLKRHNLSTTELETSIRAMKSVEDSLKRADGIGITKAYDETVNSLRKSHSAVGRQVAVQYAQEGKSGRELENMLPRNRTLNFKGYNHMVSAYFEALAQNAGKVESTEEK
ncbi:MAG: hypothetical protein CEE38_20620 [Planctomycetes bacterium B3_Pla]|nr:MAG: hypothetical protein CEE38_20620 [Planctomycetes bacterium B3_Pla]